MKNSEENKKAVDSTSKSIGERAKKVIKLRGLTQDKVAEKLGYSPSTLSEKLSGKYSLDIDTIVNLSKILDCSTDFLLGQNEFPSKNPSVPQMSTYTGLTNAAIERLHTFIDTKYFNQYYRIMPSPDPRFPDYTKKKIREEFGDDKLFMSLFEAKPIVWLSNFISHGPLCMEIENCFITLLSECYRSQELDSIQKDLMIQRKNNSSDSERINDYYDRILLEQQSCENDIKTILTNIFDKFSKFCKWYCEILQNQAEEEYNKNNHNSSTSKE